MSLNTIYDLLYDALAPFYVARTSSLAIIVLAATSNIIRLFYNKAH